MTVRGVLERSRRPPRQQHRATGEQPSDIQTSQGDELEALIAQHLRISTPILYVALAGELAVGLL